MSLIDNEELSISIGSKGERNYHSFGCMCSSFHYLYYWLLFNDNNPRCITSYYGVSVDHDSLLLCSDVLLQ